MKVTVFSVFTLFLLISGCIFDGTEVNYDYRRFEAELGFQIDQVVDNGFFLYDIILYTEDGIAQGFFLIDSPDLIDSVFTEANYSSELVPRLEEFFPENGKLLVYCGFHAWSHLIDEQRITASGSTVRIDHLLKEYTGQGTPMGYAEMVIPVGVIPSR